MHKDCLLIKRLMVIRTDGYIVSVMEPFFADDKNSDAHILNKMLNTNVEGIVDWLN